MEWSRLYLTYDFKCVLDLFMCSFAPERCKNTRENVYSGQHSDLQLSATDFAYGIRQI